MVEAPVTIDRRAGDMKITALSARVEELAEQHKTLSFQLDENTALTKEVHASTSGLVEAWAALSGGLKVLNWLGRAAKWVTYIAGMVSAVGAVWYMWQHGAPLDAPK